MLSAILFVQAQSQVGAVSLFQLHHFALNYTFLHSITLFCTQLHFFALNYTFCTDLGLIEMFLTNQNAEIVACILLVKQWKTKMVKLTWKTIS